MTITDTGFAQQRSELVKGSNIDPAMIAEAGKMVGDSKCVLVCLDSVHTHDHVLEDLHAYLRRCK